MKNHTNTPIDRDRAFDINVINELLTQGKAILTQAITISQKMENSIAAIASIYSGIDAEYQVGALGSDIAALSGKLRRDIYQETITRMDTILTKLINDIPSYDTALAQSMDAIEETLHTVKGRINELRSLLDTGDVDLSYPQFSQRLQDLKTGWDMTTEDLAQLLTEIENDMLGVSAAAVQYSKDPVNLSTGNFVYDHEDIRINGEIPLTFHRYYNARSRGKDSLGRCFVHNYQIRLEQDPEKGKATVTMGDGQKKTFRKTPEGTYQSLHSALETLTKQGDNYVLETLTGEKTLFDQSGHMTRQENRNARGTTFTYDAAGRLHKAETDNHTSLTYTYDEDGQLTRVTDHTGRYVELTYEKGKLATVKTPQGSTYAYRYAKNGRIEQTVNPRGHTTVKNTYDEKRRVTRQEFPDGGHMDYTYDDSRRQVILTERNGSKITYLHDSRYRNTDILYEDGTREHFAYNEKNQKTLHTDRNGNTTRMSYDNRGNLTQFINPLGEKTSLTYNAHNQLTTLKVNGKEKLCNSYDSNGNLIFSALADGRKREIVYDEKGHPKQIILPDGSIIKLAHDERGNISSITNPYNVTVNYGYDALNRVIQVMDNEGNGIFYQYDEKDCLVSERNQEGAVRNYVYDECGRLIRTVDFDGGVLTVDYNILGKMEKVTDKEGNVTELRYNTAGNLSEEISPTGVVLMYKYDGDNRLIQVKFSMPQQEETVRVVDYIYDPAGNLLKVQVGNGKELMSAVSYEYDALNRITAVINPVGGKMTYTYDKMSGKISSITDVVGNRRIFHYNETGELIKETDARGNTTKYEYNALGKITCKIDGARRATRHYYLPGGRREKTVYPDGTQVSYGYDSLGRLKKKTCQSGYSISYNYDCAGRILSATTNTGQKKSYTYDAVGNVVSIIDANGNITKYAYTKNGKLREIIDAFGNKTEYTYDKADRLIRLCERGKEDEIDRMIEYRRDAFGRIECVYDALGGEEHFRYDALGRMTEKTDREGLVTAYTYTADNRLENILYSDGTKAQLEYTPLRQLAMVKDWLGETRIERDSHGMPISITDHKGRVVSYKWGSMGQRQEMIYPDGTRINWTYDNLLRPIRLERVAGNNNTLWIDCEYDNQGRLYKQKNSGGYITKWRYNETGLLEELLHEDASGIFDMFHYTYDAIGNRTAIKKERRGFQEESGSYRYSYDRLQRLTGVEKDGTLLRSYRYDSFGNRTEMEDFLRGTKTFSKYDVLNRLLAQEVWQNTFTDFDINSHDIIYKTYIYDKRGNLTEEYQGGELLHGYTFNSMNRLQKVWNKQEMVAEYFYNALGQRTERRVGGETEEYLLDLTKSYNNLIELHKGKKKQNFYWDFNLSAMEDESKEVQYYLLDELGSPLHVLNRNGHGADYGYDEFGNDIHDFKNKFSSGKKYSRQGESQPFGYTGYRFDNISGTYFAQTREYMAHLGIFNKEDLIRQGSNWYLYCNANPLKYIDPLGLDAILINKEVDNVAGDILGVEHMGAFFQDENDDWYFFFWGDKVVYEKIEDPDIFESIDTMNEYLFDHNLYEMENKPYIDSVYIRGDFTASHKAAIELQDIYNDSGKEFNSKYNLLWRNCGQVTMRLFKKGVLPGGMKVSTYMMINGYGNSVIPNWNMINMQNIFHNSAINLMGFNDAVQQLYEKYEKHPIWYFYEKYMLDIISGCAE